MVRRRAGASRGLAGQERQASLEPRQERADGKTLTRAAASSMASGSPSNRRQISAASQALAGVSRNSMWTARRRSTKSRTASDAAI